MPRLRKMHSILTCTQKCTSWHALRNKLFDIITCNIFYTLVGRSYKLYTLESRSYKTLYTLVSRSYKLFTNVSISYKLFTNVTISYKLFTLVTISYKHFLYMWAGATNFIHLWALVINVQEETSKLHLACNSDNSIFTILTFNVKYTKRQYHIFEYHSISAN